jgi:hypothetical protein
MIITFDIIGTLVVAVAIAAYSFYQQRSLAQCVRQLLAKVEIDDGPAVRNAYPSTATQSIVPSQDSYAGKKAQPVQKQPASLADSIMSMSKPFEHE